MFWDDILINETIANNITVAVALGGGIPEDERKGLTVTRELVQFSVQAVTINTSGLFSAGIYLCENDALAALIFADPQEMGDDPGWLWRIAGQVWSTSSVFDSAQFLKPTRRP